MTILGDLCSFKAGVGFPQAEQGISAGDLPWIKVSDLSLAGNGLRITGANNWVTIHQAARLKAVVVESESIVFAKIGEGLKAERLRIIDRPTALDNNLMAATARPGCVDPRYLYYLLRDLNISEWAVGSALPYLTQGGLAEIPVAPPSMSEQRAIAEVLGALDDKIAANDRAAGLAEELLRAKFDQMGLVDELGDGGAKLSDLVELQPRRVATGEVPFIDMQAIPTRGWTLPAPSYREARGGARFTNGDTLLARITPCLENRKTAYVNDLPDRVVGAGSTEFIVMRSRDPHPLPLSFFVATDETFRSYAIQHMVGTSGRQRVSAVDLAHFPISMPAPEALREWGRLADPMFARVRSMGRENRILATLRDALLPELMSGRLRVKDAETTVEEVV